MSSAGATRTASPAKGPATCVPSATLIGRFVFSTEDAEGTWWYLTKTGMLEAGLTEILATIEGW